MGMILTKIALWQSVYSESVCATVADGGRFDWAAGYLWNDHSSIYPRRLVQNRAFYTPALFWFSESILLDNERSRARFSCTVDVAPYGNWAAIAAMGVRS